MQQTDFVFSANLRVLARQAYLELRSPMNTDPDPVDLPILGEIAALTARAKAEFEQLIREHRGYSVGDTVRRACERSLGAHAPTFRVLGFGNDPDFGVVVFLGRVKKNGEVGSRVEQYSIVAGLDVVAEPVSEAA